KRKSVALTSQSRSAVEPGKILVPVLRRFCAHDGVAKAGVFAGGMIDVLADRAREQLHASGARKTLLAIVFQRGRVIAGMAAQHMRQADRVFHRLAGALREILQHRVGGLTEQHDASIAPSLRRIAVAQYPQLPVLAVTDDAL